MGKTAFVFDKESGTLQPRQYNADMPTSFSQPQENADAQKVDDEVSLDLSTQKPNISNENIIQFRESSDHTIFQVTDDRTRKTMMIIAGYGLEIKFNMAELRSTEKIEQLLGGLTSMFRKMILEQALNKQKG